MPQFCTYICCPVTPRAGWRGTGAMTNTFEEISPVSICFSLSFSTLPFQPHQHQLLGLTTLKLSICAWAPHVLFIFISPLTRIKILRLLWRGQKSNLWPVGSKETLRTHRHQRRDCGRSNLVLFFCQASAKAWTRSSVCPWCHLSVKFKTAFRSRQTNCDLNSKPRSLISRLRDGAR